MAIDTERGHWGERGLVLLWLAALAGPVAALMNIGVGYALVKWSCATGHTELLTGVAMATLALSMIGAAVAATVRTRLRDATEDGGGDIIDRSRFAATVAVGLSLISALLIALATFPHFVLSPCE